MKNLLNRLEFFFINWVDGSIWSLIVYSDPTDVTVGEAKWLFSEVPRDASDIIDHGAVVDSWPFV